MHFPSAFRTRSPRTRVAPHGLTAALLLAIALPIAFVALLAVAGAARAHGEAHWIETNKRYVGADGTHCCGIADGNRRQAVYFREAPEGVYVTLGAGGEVLIKRELGGRGLYPSIDDTWWLCIRNGVVRCVFKPTTGG